MVASWGAVILFESYMTAGPPVPDVVDMMVGIRSDFILKPQGTSGTGRRASYLSQSGVGVRFRSRLRRGAACRTPSTGHDGA